MICGFIRGRQGHPGSEYLGGQQSHTTTGSDAQQESAGTMTRHKLSPNQVTPFPPGTLWERLRAATDRALQLGALEPIRTHATVLPDRSTSFLVRVVANLRRKPPGNDSHNPFLPYESSLYVADASPGHVCILNKYNVVDLHLLIITRHFEHQESALTLSDFQALWHCMIEYDSLGFYNSGTASGASQKHKHLQVVPLPLAAEVLVDKQLPTVPLEPLLPVDSLRSEQVVQVEDLPFAHAFVCWDDSLPCDTRQLAQRTFDSYRALLARVGIPFPRSSQQLITQPYNLLVTRRWMLLVPRVLECFQAISLNSLAFAGAMLVQNEAQLARLREAGPLTALAHVAPRNHLRHVLS